MESLYSVGLYTSASFSSPLERITISANYFTEVPEVEVVVIGELDQVTHQLLQETLRQSQKLKPKVIIGESVLQAALQVLPQVVQAILGRLVMDTPSLLIHRNGQSS